MDDYSGFALGPWERERLGRVRLSDATPPPWVDGTFDPDAAAHLQAEFVDTIRDMSDELGNPGAKELEVLQFMFYRAATWGWDAAMNNGPTSHRNAVAAAAAARKSKADEDRAKVVAAFDRAAAAGCEPDIDAIARECGVSRATAYRALGNRK